MHKTLQNNIKRGFWANGYLLTGSVNIPELIHFLKKHGEVSFIGGIIGINEARDLKKKVIQSTDNVNSRSFFILNADQMSRFVYEAILKTVEDIPPDRHFFIISSKPDTIPETMRSRLIEVVFSSKSEEKNASVVNLSRFINVDGRSRVKLIEKIAEDKERFSLFLNDLEKDILDKNKHELLPKIREARESSEIFNISRKMCLEYLTAYL